MEFWAKKKAVRGDCLKRVWIHFVTYGLSNGRANLLSRSYYNQLTEQGLFGQSERRVICIQSSCLVGRNSEV